VFFEELVEQHRVHRVIAHRVDIAVRVAHNEVRMGLPRFLGQ
jgi:hypothetical protein